MEKLDELDLARWQLAHANIALATQARDYLGEKLLAKYGLPGEARLQVGPDGTIVREPKSEST
jgi:hypothetical protein